MTLERLFDQAARDRIAAAVQAAEQKTVGQIVPVVVGRSCDYHGFQRGLGLVVLALGLQLGLALRWPDLAGVSAEGLLATLGVWMGLCALPPFAKLFERRDFQAAVHERAFAAFAQEGVHETKEGTGVLIFASLYERQALILGDRAIHAKMGEAGWKAAIDALVQGLGQRDAAAGFCAAIALVGEKLAQEFPRASPNELGNELSDELRVRKE